MTILPTDQASIYDALRTLQTGGRTLALVSPSTLPAGIGGFLFDIALDEQMELESEVSQHFVEDQSSVSDHIANRPETVVVSGLVAELIGYTPELPVASQPSEDFEDAPGLDADIAEGEAEALEIAAVEALTYPTSIAAAASGSLYGYYQSKSPQASASSRQTAAAGYFYQLWKGKILCTVDTPFGVLTDMAVERVSLRQPEASKSTTEFSVSFKKIRKAKVAASFGKLLGRCIDQAAETVNNGRASFTTVSDEKFNDYLAKVRVPTE